MFRRTACSILILLGFVLPALADEKKLDREKVLEELDVPKTNLQLGWTITSTGGLKKPEDYWPVEKKINSRKEKLSRLDSKEPIEERAKLYSELAIAMLNVGREDEAQKYFQLAVKEYEGLLKDDKKNVKLLYNLSHALRLSGEKEKARKLLLSVIEINPDFYEAYGALLPDWTSFQSAHDAADFVKWKKPGEKYFEEEFKKGKSDPKFYEEYFSFNLSVRISELHLSVIKEKDTITPETYFDEWAKCMASERAFEIAKKAVELDSENVLYRIWLGSLHLTDPARYWVKIGFERAKKAEKERSEEDEIKMLRELFREVAKVKSKELKVAEEHLLFAYRKKAFEYTILFTNLAYLQTLKSDWQKAQEYLLQAIKSHPLDDSFYNALLGVYAVFLEEDSELHATKMDEMVKLLEQRNNVEPGAETHFLIGKIKYRKDDFKGALKAFDSSLKLSPDHFNANLGKAAALLKTDKLKDATLVLEHVKVLIGAQGRESIIEGYLTIAIHCMLTGRHDNAREILHAIAQSVPENKKAKRLLEMLKQE